MSGENRDSLVRIFMSLILNNYITHTHTHTEFMSKVQFVPQAAAADLPVFKAVPSLVRRNTSATIIPVSGSNSPQFFGKKQFPSINTLNNRLVDSKLDFTAVFIVLALLNVGASQDGVLKYASIWRLIASAAVHLIYTGLLNSPLQNTFFNKEFVNSFDRLFGLLTIRTSVTGREALSVDRVIFAVAMFLFLSYGMSLMMFEKKDVLMKYMLVFVLPILMRSWLNNNVIKVVLFIVLPILLLPLLMQYKILNLFEEVVVREPNGTQVQWYYWIPVQLLMIGVPFVYNRMMNTHMKEKYFDAKRKNFFDADHVFNKVHYLTTDTMVFDEVFNEYINHGNKYIGLERLIYGLNYGSYLSIPLSTDIAMQFIGLYGSSLIKGDPHIHHGHACGIVMLHYFYKQFLTTNEFDLKLSIVKYMLVSLLCGFNVGAIELAKLVSR